MSRQIAIKLSCEGHGTVSLPALVRTLDALQKVLLQVGEMHQAQSPAEGEHTRRSRGQFRGTVRAACELQVVDLQVGSAAAVLEAPPPEPSLFVEDSDLGLLSLRTVRDLTAEVSNGASWERVHKLLPLEAHRSLILDSYRRLCPTKGEDAELAVWDPDAPQVVHRLLPETRVRVQMLRAQATPDDTLQERLLIGRIDVLQAHPFQCTLVLPQGASLSMPFDEERAEEYRPLWDQTVAANVICRVIANADADDTIVEIREVVEIAPLDDTPLQVSTIHPPGGALPLRQPLCVPPDFSDNLVTFECGELDIVAYGPSREEAEEAFRAELAWLWEEYAQAGDEELSPEARLLKQRLHELVEGGPG